MGIVLHFVVETFVLSGIDRHDSSRLLGQIATDITEGRRTSAATHQRFRDNDHLRAHICSIDGRVHSTAAAANNEHVSFVYCRSHPLCLSPSSTRIGRFAKYFSLASPPLAKPRYLRAMFQIRSPNSLSVLIQINDIPGMTETVLTHAID